VKAPRTKLCLWNKESRTEKISAKNNVKKFVCGYSVRQSFYAGLNFKHRR
jgi:hypothetical protein